MLMRNDINEMFNDLKEFIFTDPRIPDPEKDYTKTFRLKITNENSREEIIEEVVSKYRPFGIITACTVYLQKNGQDRLASFY